MFDLSGKKALVTGGGKGIGKAIAEALLEHNAEVVITGSSNSVLHASEELREKGFNVHSVKGDLSNRKKLNTVFNESINILGTIDILVNNAGVQYRSIAEKFPLEAWDKVIELNLSAVFQLSQLAANIMLKKGKGKIINMSSMLSFFGGYTVPAYAASKGGVLQLTKAFSNEWAGKGINVNAIAPGYIDTELNTALINDNSRNKEIMARIPKGRWGKPEDMKGVAVFLASDASDYINGTVIPVDGGFLSR